ncbi:MAG: DUF2271 domain-containing protein [Fuerstiella sp.]
MTIFLRTKVLVLLCAVHATCTAGDFVFFHENVLGTSLELRVCASSLPAANAAEASALREIDRLSHIFSHYDANSEFSQFLNVGIGEVLPVSNELAEMLQRCEEWTRVSDGAFNIGSEQISRLWQEAEAGNVSPTQEQLTKAVHHASGPHWLLDRNQQTVVRLTDCALSLNAIAKGSILDSVCETVLASSPEVTGVMLNIGGDLRVAGHIAQSVQIAHPMHDAIGPQSLHNIELLEGAIATSGSSERGFQIGSNTYSHILNPQTAEPVAHVVSASVMAEDAATADAIATICNVLPTATSLALVNAIPNVECLLITASGASLLSNNWPATATADEAQSSDAKARAVEPTGHTMKIEFEITKPANSARYRRPYVAVWVEDKDGFPVKTLSLFMMTENPGPRWHRDLRRWYASDQMRRLVDEKSIIDTVSKPTRNPGTYKVEWDGRDDGGKLLKPGAYTLNLESAREHGTYQLMKQSFEFGGKSFSKDLKGNVEIKSASVNYSNKQAD